MERLVVVGLRHCDVVLESSFDRKPHGVDDAENRVAFDGRVADYADTEDIVDFVNLLLPLLYLHVDGVGMLHSSGDLYVLEAFLSARFLYRSCNLLDECVVFALSLQEICIDVLVAFRLECLERKILELALERLHTEAVGNGSEDVETVACVGYPPLAREPGEGTHVMKLVRQLYEDDSEVLAHGEEHLLYGLGFLNGLVLSDPAYLRHCLDHGSDFLSEEGGYLLLRRPRVLDCVMKKSCTDRVGIHVE